MRAINEDVTSLTSSKRPTIRDVADILGIHKSTVSVALSGKGTLAQATRDRIVTVAHEMGYVPNLAAQRLANGYRNPAVCIVGGGATTGLATETTLLIQRELTKEALVVPLYNCVSRGAGGISEQWIQIRQICQQEPRALIYVSEFWDDTIIDELRSYQNAGGVVIACNARLPIDCDQVAFDREQSLYTAAKYLLNRGHQKIGLGIRNDQWGSTANPNGSEQRQIAGFERAAAEYGISPVAFWRFNLTSFESNGVELANKFISMNDRPTALCIDCDRVAYNLIQTLLTQGIRVPDDVSIVGYNCYPEDKYAPLPLTVVTEPIDQVAMNVVQLLLRRLADKTCAPRHVTISGELIERGSVSSLNIR
jgi:DNA-binding LacI/PurR family transcriptional regulator